MSLRQTANWQILLKIGAIGLAYAAVAELTFAFLNLEVEAAPVWFPAGVAFTAVFLAPAWGWVGVLLGSWLFNQSLNVTWTLALLAAIGSTLQAAVGAFLLRRVGFHEAMERVQDALTFVLLGTVVAPAVSASIGAYTGVHLDPPIAIGANWWTLWLGDGTGSLLLAALLLVWRQPESWRLSERHWEWLLWIGAVVLSTSSVFYSQTGATIVQYPLEYLPFPFVIAAALRLGPPGAVVASFVLSAIALMGTVAGFGPFEAKAQSTSQTVLLLQAFVSVIAITALVLAAAVTEQRKAEEQLRLSTQRVREGLRSANLQNEIALRIRHSLDLNAILSTTVEEVRQFLQADRVFLIRRCDSSGRGAVIAESVAPNWTPAIGWQTDAAAYEEIQAVFQQQPMSVVEDVSKIQQSPFLADYYQRFQIQAAIAIPILLDNNLFGVLVVNQCCSPRQWQPTEVELLERLTTQVAIAIQQGQLYQQVQDLNANLEAQVTDRTAQLQQKMAELEELNHVRDLLLHAIAHDLRTTVMGTLMVLNHLQNQEGDPIAMPRHLLERMSRSGEVQLTKLNTLLETYRNKTEGVALVQQSIAFYEVIESVLTELQPLFEQNQTVVTNLVPAVLPPIWADRRQTHRILLHLLTNAVKHNPPGVEITLKAIAVNEFLHCTIEDIGRGITPDQEPQLFDLRLRGSGQQRLGLGVGLCLCHQLVAAHGGEIGVDSTPGYGSSFWFTLPLMGQN